VTAAAGAPPRPGYAHAVHSFLALSDGRVAVTSDSPDVTLWDAAAGVACARLGGHAERVWAAVELPSRTLLATASWDATLRLWDLSADECAAELKGHTGKVWCLAALGEARLVSGSWDGTIRVWDIRHQACLNVLADHHADVYGLCVHPARPFLFVSSSRDTSLRVWRLELPVTSALCARTLLGGARRQSPAAPHICSVGDARPPIQRAARRQSTPVPAHDRWQAC
jgi:WD40 repeat protein